MWHTEDQGTGRVLNEFDYEDLGDTDIWQPHGNGFRAIPSSYNFAEKLWDKDVE